MMLSNFAWGTYKRLVAKWNDLKKPFSDFIKDDPDWAKEFLVWRLGTGVSGEMIYFPKKCILINFTNTS
ncbi:MAG: hypothetical protein ABSA76_06980 [Bacteroidales bacterium]